MKSYVGDSQVCERGEVIGKTELLSSQAEGLYFCKEDKAKRKVPDWGRALGQKGGAGDAQGPHLRRGEHSTGGSKRVTERAEPSKS